jgi:hypothetical protein
MPVSSWSTTPASNNAAPPNGAPEGMAPGSVNDVIRQNMADIKSFYDNSVKLDAVNVFSYPQDSSGYGVFLSSTQPAFALKETDATVNNKVWDFIAVNDQLLFRVANDAITSATSWLDVDRTLNVVDSINLKATAVQVNGVDITASTGTFTATLASGLTTTPTGTLTYKKIGNVVTLYNNTGATISGTSNSGSFSITGLPAAIQPSTARFLPTHWLDNGSTVAGGCSISAAGAITASNGSGAFTSSGTKGIPSGWSVTYPI